MGDKGGIALSIGASACIVIVVVTAIALYFTGVIKLPDLSVALGGKAADKTADKTAEKKDIWSDWTTGECSKTCGTGARTKTRTCITPADGVGCIGETTKTEPCNISPCDVWSDWVPGACSKECGTGTRTKTRTCVTPGDGVNCKGDTTKTEPCNTFPCAAGWGAWVNGTCSTKCGPGTIKRERVCVNPALGCEGPAETSDECNLGPCPIDGVWSDWKSTGGACTQECGGGEITQTRTCTAPQNGGKPCEGPSERKIECNKERCFTKMEILQKTANIPIDLTEVNIYDASHTKIRPNGYYVTKSSNYPFADYPGSNLFDENEDTFMHTDSTPTTTQNVKIDFKRSIKIAYIDIVSRPGFVVRANNLEIVLYKPSGATETLKMYPGMGGGPLKNRWGFALAPVSTYYWIVIEDMDFGNISKKLENPNTPDAFSALQECEKDAACSVVAKSSSTNSYIAGTEVSLNSFITSNGSTTFIRSDRVDKINTAQLNRCTVPGTFDDNCLDAMWKKVGCTTDLRTSMSSLPDGKSFDSQQKYWNERSQADVWNDMKTWSTGTTDYHTMACRGVKGPGPCDNQNNAPISTECLNDIWKKVGCVTTIPSHYSGWWKTKNKSEVQADMALYKNTSNCNTMFTT